MTQVFKILKYIDRFGSITTMDAFADLGVTRLASRVWDIRQLGFGIKSEVESGVNRFDEAVSYNRYSFSDFDKDIYTRYCAKVRKYEKKGEMVSRDLHIILIKEAVKEAVLSKRTEKEMREKINESVYA